MSDEYGIDDNFFNEVQDSVKGAIKEKQLLKPEERREVIDIYKEHVKKQMTIENIRERTLFTDKYGTVICLMLTPKKIVKKGKIQNEPEICKNGSYRIWGANLPLKGKYNQITVFGESKKALVGHNQKILTRGAMTIKYKYGTENAMFEKPFVKFMKGIYEELHPDREVNGLDDIDYIDYYDDYTFNIWETLILFGGK